MARSFHLLRSFLFTLALAPMAWLSGTAMAAGGGDCAAQAGSTYMDYGPICLTNGQAYINGVPQGDAVVPPGYQTAYLLSRTNGLVLEQVGPSPHFLVTTADVWRIHTLVFHPATFDVNSIQFGSTTAYDLAQQMVQGGGGICASISFTVGGSKTTACEAPCTAFAPQMSMDSTTVCLVDGHATLTAVSDGNQVIPQGFQLAFLLSRTNALVIDQVATTPSFTVAGVDVWRIHSFVYDPATFSLATIHPGSTSIYDLYAQLLQGGVPVCASLTVNGAFVKTGACTTTCLAAAGSLSTSQPDLCLAEGMAVLHAQPNGDAVIPAGFSMAFLLSFGSNQVIMAQGAAPDFTVAGPGHYSIHALVYNPATFSPASLLPGTTTLAALHAQLMAGVDGGGPICVGLDLPGTGFQVADCTPLCDADAGSMAGDGQFLCLEQGSALLEAVSAGDTVVPPGFVLRYLLSHGPQHVLEAMADQPAFTVNSPGDYRIHAFVIDPATWDANNVEWGTTTSIDLNLLLVQGGGTVCAGFDVLGASFTVAECPPPCDAGTDNTIHVCMGAPPFAMIDSLGGHPCPFGTWTNPANPDVSGIFNPASDAAGTYTYTVATGTGAQYISVLTIFVMECPTVGDLAQSDQDRDGTGLQSAAGCFPDLGRAGSVLVWPNPSSSEVHVALPYPLEGNTLATLHDATGRIVRSAMSTGANGELVLDVRHLPAGLWTLRAISDGRAYTAQFIHLAQ